MEVDKKGNFKNLPKEWAEQLNLSEKESEYSSDILESHIESELLSTK